MNNDKPTVDYVNEPPHYKSEKGIECIDVVDTLDFCTGNAIKYLWRAGKKNPDKTIEDLEKAIFYINRRIKIEKEKNAAIKQNQAKKELNKYT